MKTQIHTQRKIELHGRAARNFSRARVSAHAADPRTNGWFTTYSGKYARIYTNNAMLASRHGADDVEQRLADAVCPAYCGVQEVYSSSNWVYVRSTGLASYNMGPWQNGAFPNLPVNQKLCFTACRARTPCPPRKPHGGGQIGIFVDGVEMFNSWDAFYWNGSADHQRRRHRLLEPRRVCE
jgi:hypothetical protein